MHNRAALDEGRVRRGGHSARRATTRRQLIENILNTHQGGYNICGGSNKNNNKNNVKNGSKRVSAQYNKVDYTTAKEWMERRLSKFKSGMPKAAAAEHAEQWIAGVDDIGDGLDHRIVELEAAQILKEYKRWHVPRLGDMSKDRPDGVFRLALGQLNSASSQDVRDRKIGQINQVIDEWDVQGGALSEVGVNWLSYPSSYSFASWFTGDREIKATVAHNTNVGENISKHQPGGIALFATKELSQYVKTPSRDWRNLGRWHSWLFYQSPNHRFRLVCGYHTGKQCPKGTSTIYQQQVRYIQEHNLDTTPSELFMTDFVAQLRTWKNQGDRLLVSIDMNEPVLNGALAKRLMGPGLGLLEAMHETWGPNEPHTFIGGRIAIDGVYHTDDLEVVSRNLLSFHEGFGDHRTAIIDISTLSAIGSNEYRVVRAQARRLNTKNHKSLKGYVNIYEEQLDRHHLQERLDRVTAEIGADGPTEEQRLALERIDIQHVEIMKHAEAKCRKITKGEIPFSGPVKTWIYRKRAYQALLRRARGQDVNNSNILRFATECKIADPKSLSTDQIKDGITFCNRRLKQLKKSGKGLRRVMLRDRLVNAQDMENKEKAKGIRATINSEESKFTWRTIGVATDDPRLGATRKVQRVVDGELVDITDKSEMEQEIQQVTEKRFDLAHSAPVSMSTLIERMGYMSDTDFAQELFAGTVELPDDLDPATTVILEEICRLGMEIRSSDGEVFDITPDEFRKYWKKVKENTSSSISGVHFGHYKAAATSEKLTKFLSQKITVTARAGCPPSRWGNGLQVMLEKIAGVALVNKLRAILLMEADYNFYNKYTFGVKAMQKLYEEGYVPHDHYSRNQSTSEDAKMDNRLTGDISRQRRHPYATTSCDASNCYDRLHHLIISFLCLALMGSAGLVVSLFLPIETMKFFQRTALGDSLSFMGGPERGRPFMGLCQGNGAAPACWLMLSSVLIHCYHNLGYGARMTSSIRDRLIKFLGTMFVDDTDLVSWLPNLTDSRKVFFDMQESLLMWGTLLCATGGAFKPEKCYWYMVDYVCDENGVWDYAAIVEREMLIPMPDGSKVPIQQLDVNEAREMLGVFSCPSGDDSKHIEEKILGRISKWTTRTKNGHLPSKLGWLSYRFKLWPGMRYGLATLATTYEEACNVLAGYDFKILSFLGVNRNIKKEWRTLPRAFGGVGLFSFPVEQMIAWLNMLTQHFGVPSTLGDKFYASLEALQIEIGCIGNPFFESYQTFGHLATKCWFKCVWERFNVFRFVIFLAYPELELPREQDILLVALFVAQGFVGEELKSLNRCRLCLQLMFLSDVVCADGKHMEADMLLPPSRCVIRSKYIFPRECPTEEDWALWTSFWHGYLDTGWVLPIPLGKWVAQTHRLWQWYHDEEHDIITKCVYTRDEQDGALGPLPTLYHYHSTAESTRTRSSTTYKKLRSEVSLPAGAPTSVFHQSENYVISRSVGPSFHTPQLQSNDFWTHLDSFGGEWMWEHIDEKEKKDIEWIPAALKNGTAVLVTDGSYDRMKAPSVSGAGWMVVCTKTHKRLRGSFYEISHSASPYRGELLGLVALHTLVWGMITFYNLDAAKGTIACDNEGALYKSSYRPLRIKSGAKQADLLRALRSLKLRQQFQLQYEWVASHQDDIKPWWQLSLFEQLNVKADGLAKSAVTRSLLHRGLDRGRQLLPLEKIAIFVDNKKMTTDVGKEVRFYLGKEEARAFYTKERQVVNGVNKGGLGWTNDRFEAVDWLALHNVLDNKPDMFGLWLSKQQAGVCATRSNMARIQDLVDDKCPNCLQPQEKSSHLNHCPDHGRTLLFKESVAAVATWMTDRNRTEGEMAYYIEKYLLFRGSRTFASLGPMSPRMQKAAISQDLIGWDEFLHGKVSVEFLAIQGPYCVINGGRLTGEDWMKKFISHLIHISHSQWIFRNFTLHDHTRGYLRLQERKEVLAQIEQLVDCDPDEIPEGSKFLLEMDFETLYDSTFEKQSYWVRAMKAARRAGRRTAALLTNRGASHRRRAAKRRALKPVVDNSELEKQLSIEMGLIPPPARRRPHPAGEEAKLKSNKRYKKPD